MKKEKNKFKHLTDNQEHVDFVSDLVKNHGKSITHAVVELCDKLDYPYSDSLRRVFSKKLEKEGVTDSKKELPIEQSDEYKEALNRELTKSNTTSLLGHRLKHLFTNSFGVTFNPMLSS